MERNRILMFRSFSRRKSTIPARLWEKDLSVPEMGIGDSSLHDFHRLANEIVATNLEPKS